MIKAVIFDLFNTLVIPPSLSTNQKILRRHHINFEKNSPIYQWMVRGFPQAWIADEMGINIKTMRDFLMVTHISHLNRIAEVFKDKIKAKPQQKTIQKTAATISSMIQASQLTPGIKKVLNTLKKNKIKLALISNTSSPWLSLVKHLNLNRWFRYRFFSCQIGAKKPNEKIFQYGLKLLKLNKNEVLMIGDSLERDIQGSRKVGIDAIWFDPNYHHGQQPIPPLDKPIHTICDLQREINERKFI